MKKHYFGKSSRVFITAGFLALLSVGANAQTDVDRKMLKSKAKVSVLKGLKTELNKTVVTERQLQSFAKQKNVPFRTEDKKTGRVMQLVGIDGAGQPIYFITDNEKSAITSGVNHLHAGGISGYDLSGKDVTIVEWDGGRVRKTHRELVGRVVDGKDVGTVATSLNDHATHVAGTVIASGVDSKAKGMAPEANLISYDFNSSYQEIANSLEEVEGVISTHSYGMGAGWSYGILGYTWGGDTNVSSTIDYKFGYYSEYDQFIDLALKAYPWHTFVRSAGNHRGEGPTDRPDGQELDGGESGYDSVSFGSLAKNAIIVGAVNPVLSYSGPESVTMTSFSSWGPTDDGRIVPTIVADGANVYSSVSSSDDAYNSMSGTSMATPSASGAIALIQDFAKQKTNAFFSSPLIKSIITNTAKEAGNQGPDYTYGFGLLDAKAAVETIDYKGKTTDYREGTLANGETVTLTYEVQEGVPFKATLAWLDRPGTPKANVGDTTPKDPSFLNDRTPKLVDDLDLRIELNGVTYLPYVLDPENPANVATTGDNIVDNIEQIYIENPTSGTLTLTFTHKGTLEEDGVEYGLAVSGIAVDKDLAVESIVTSVPQNETSSQTSAVATIKNVGKTDFGAFSVKFQAKDPAGTVVSEKTVQVNGVAVGQSVTATANFNLTELFTDYTISAELVSSEDEIKANNVAFGVATPVVADLRAGGTQMLQKFNFAEYADHSWEVVNTVGSTPTWALTSADYKGNDGSQFALNPSQGAAANDWLISNPVLLQAGSRYKVSYYTAKNSSNSARNENVQIFVGNTKDVAGMSTALNKYTWDQTDVNGTFKKVEFEFIAEQTGLQYFGIHHTSDTGKTSWLVAVDDFRVVNMEAGLPTPDFGYTTLNGDAVVTKYTSVKMDNSTVANPEAIAWNWQFTPSTVTFEGGTSATSKEPQLRFNEEGTYSVKLMAVNANGSATAAKYSYINVVSPTINAGFSLDRDKVYAQENVQFTNLTSGSPAPTSYRWTITPNEVGAFNFLEGTSQISDHLNVKFNKAGVYSVKLETYTEAGTKVAEIQNAVTVLANTNPPLNNTANKDQNAITVDWDMPKPQYNESYVNETFEDTTFPPNGWNILDNNADNNTWRRVRFVESDQVAAAVYSWSGDYGPMQTDDYLSSRVIEFLPPNYNELTFNAYGDPDYTDNLKIFLVEVADETPLTAEQIQAGVKVYDDKPSVNGALNKASLGNNFEEGKKYRLVFYSNNYDQFVAAIKNVKISEPGTITESIRSAFSAENTKTGRITKKLVQTAREEADGTIVLSNGTEALPAAKPNWQQITIGYSNQVTSYEVYRNGEFLSTVPGAENTIYIDNFVTQNGTYCYTVVAVYDGMNKSEESNEACVEVSTLSAVDVNKGAQFTAFPNPVVDAVKVKFAERINGKATVELYAMDGKKVVTKTLSQTELAETGVNVSSLASGAYVLVVKDSTNTYTTKLIKK